MDMEKLNHLYAVDKTWHALYRILNFLITEIFDFLFFGIIIISIIVIVVNFINKNDNKTIIKEKNPTNNKIKKELNKLKKLYKEGLIIKKDLEEKTKGNFKII
jgi:large-conductance mechanosensitive channel